MEEALEKLQLRCDSKTFREAVETLIRIHRNIKDTPTEEKYRSIRKENRTFKELWKYPEVRNFLKDADWEEENDKVVLNDITGLAVTLDILVEHRMVKPTDDEWTEDNQVIVANEESEKEKQLKEKAIAERDKELAEFYKEKKEKTKIAEAIRAEHREDMQKRRYAAAAKATPITPGVRVPGKGNQAN